MSKSTWDDLRITAYVLGGLSEDELSAFEKELETNSDLAAAVQEAKGLTDQLQSFYDSENTPPLDQKRREAIVSGEPAAVTPASQPVSRSEPMSWSVPGLLFAAAAVLALLIGVAPWLREQDKTVVMDTATLPSAEQNIKQRTNEQAGEKRAGDLSSMGRPSFDQQSDEVLEENDVEQKERAGGEMLRMHPSVELAAQDKMDVDSVADAKNASDAEAITLHENPPQASRAVREKAKVKPQEPAPSSAPKSNVRQNRVARRGDGIAADTSGTIPPEAPSMKAIIRSGAAPPSPAGRGRAMKKREEAIELVPEIQNAPAPSSSALPMAPTPEPAIERIEMSVEKEKIVPQKELKLLMEDVESLEQLESKTSRVPIEADKERRQIVPGKDVSVKAANPAANAGFGGAIADGEGPDKSGDQFAPITDNPFQRVSEQPLSTFSVDVDTASYSKTRDFLMRAGQLPRPDAVRIEEFVNYFDYNYEVPAADAEHPFAVDVTVTSCPWNEKHRLARVALKGKTMKKAERPPCNLVFLLDTSGSMNAPNKLPLVVEGMKMLTDQLREQDRVAIAVYAGSAGLVLDSVSAKKKKQINRALTALASGGSTDGGSGIALAYETARDHFISDGVNRVILCTDGDFNVGVTGTDALVRMVEKESKGGIFLSVLGFGMGNHNDAMLEKISGRGNGNYAFIDTENEAKKVLVDQTSGTLVTIAKDVKLQLEFNVKNVSQYRLLGYENRILAAQDFADDKKDAGEIGAGHSVTALYEIVPAGLEADASQPKQNDLRYQATEPTKAADSDELLRLALRYKQPNENTSTEVVKIIKDDGGDFESADVDVRFAAAVAGFGMQLRKSPYAGNWTMADVLRTAIGAKGKDKYELRAEFVQLVRKASEIIGNE